MTEIFRWGNLPKKVRPFLGSALPGSRHYPKVYECSIAEIERIATKEQLELNFLIDKVGTGRSFIVALGLYNRDTVELALYGTIAKPVVYFAEMNNEQRHRIMKEVAAAQAERKRQAKLRKAPIKSSPEISPSKEDIDGK